MPDTTGREGVGQPQDRGALETVLAALPAACFFLDEGNRFADYRGSSDFPLFDTPEAFLGKTIPEALPPPVASLLEEACQKARSGGGTVQTEYCLPLGNATRWFVARFRARGDGSVIALVQESTEARRAEDLLRESEERFRAFFRLSPLGTVIARASDGLILEVNEAFSRVTGHRREELIGRTSLEAGFYPSPEDRVRLMQVLRATGRVEGVETTILTKSRERRRILFSGETIRIGDESCSLAVVLDATEMFQVREELEEAHRHLETRVRERTEELEAAKEQLERDIRARIQAEEERDRLEEGLRRSQALEAVGRLAGGVAHDFNNLLASILACSYAARTNVGDAAVVSAELERIQTLCQQGGEVTRHLLTVARDPPHVLQSIDLRTEVDRLRVLAERAMDRTIATRVRLDETPLWVRGDRGLVMAALLNLCLNARDAMEDGGTLTLAAGRRREGGRDWVVVSVEDTGPGVPEGLRDLIFQPFFTTKQGGRGTGLGLSTALATAQRFGGTIEVESSPGRGSTFALLLPAAEEGSPEPPPVQAPTASAVAPAARARPPLVLVVEDEEDVGRMMEAALTTGGYRVLRARSGIVALEAVRDRRNEIRLALLDLVLPGLGGAEVHRLLRTLAPEIPVAFSTARPDLAAAANPNAPCLRKPFTEQELLDAVSGAIAAAEKSS